jgi:hypothetical protein
MYSAFLIVHSLLRWVVILFGLRAVVRALVGLATRRPWGPSDAAAGRFFAISLDVQLLIGLLLYALLSPITPLAFRNMGEAMRDPVLRFWAVEHIASMVIALVLAHIGKARTARLRGDRTKHLAALVFFTLALLVVLAAIPWPFRLVGRPWARPLF